MVHVTRATRNVGQSHCVWCGVRVTSAEPCLTDEMKLALARFAVANGHRWKSKLTAKWINGNYDSDDDATRLQQIRNQHGSRALQAVSTDRVKAFLRWFEQEQAKKAADSSSD